jgi:hypothetical protein
VGKDANSRKRSQADAQNKYGIGTQPVGRLLKCHEGDSFCGVLFMGVVDTMVPIVGFGGILVHLGEQIGWVSRKHALLLPVVGITKLDILSPFVVAVRSGFWDGRGLL